MDEGGEITHEEMGKVPPPLSQEPLVCRQTLPVLREAEAQLAPCGFPGSRRVIVLPNCFRASKKLSFCEEAKTLFSLWGII